MLHGKTRNYHLYVVLLVAVIVSVDFLFFKRQFWERLIANIGIVFVFIALFAIHKTRGACRAKQETVPLTGRYVLQN